MRSTIFISISEPILAKLNWHLPQCAHVDYGITREVYNIRNLYVKASQLHLHLLMKNHDKDSALFNTVHHIALKIPICRIYRTYSMYARRRKLITVVIIAIATDENFVSGKEFLEYALRQRYDGST